MSNLPLLFLTSNNSEIPSGRNVRTKHRSQLARQLESRGFPDQQSSLLTFRASRVGSPHRDRPGRKRTRLPQPRQQGAKPGPQDQESVPVPDIDLTDLLSLARFHIRRRASVMATNSPSRLADALRCRQWSFCAPEKVLQPGLELHQAALCVEAKMRGILEGHEDRGGEEYITALHYLRMSMQRFPREYASHERQSILAAAQLLAVYEMLGNQNKVDWTQHCIGAMAMLDNSRDVKHNGALDCRIGAQVVEVMLNGNANQAWKSTAPLDVLGLHLQSALAGFEDSAVLTTSVLDSCTTVLESRLVLVEDCSARHTLLERAHRARHDLERAISRAQPFFEKSACLESDSDILSVCLACLIALDRAIVELRPGQRSLRTHRDLQAETQMLSLQLLSADLCAAESFPARALLDAFCRQHAGQYCWNLSVLIWH